MLMIAFITASTTSQTWYCDKAEENMKNLPINPAVSGIPANDSIAMVNTSAKNGFFFDSPLKLSKLSLPDCCCTSISDAKAIIEAMEYAVAYTKTELAELAPKATIANSK